MRTCMEDGKIEASGRYATGEVKADFNPLSYGPPPFKLKGGEKGVGNGGKT